MDVADQIVVMNNGTVEQAGAPTRLYDHPATEFVMSFVGSANRIGSMLVRPHDVDISRFPVARATLAVVDRVVHLGFEVRVELTDADGSSLTAQLTRDQARTLHLSEHQTVYVRPRHAKVFGDNGVEPRDDETLPHLDVNAPAFPSAGNS